MTVSVSILIVGLKPTSANNNPLATHTRGPLPFRQGAQIQPPFKAREAEFLHDFMPHIILTDEKGAEPQAVQLLFCFLGTMVFTDFF